MLSLGDKGSETRRLFSRVQGNMKTVQTSVVANNPTLDLGKHAAEMQLRRSIDPLPLPRSLRLRNS